MKNKNYIWILGCIILIITILLFIFLNKGDGETHKDNNLKKHYCSSESRKGDACIQLYQPVCGWFNKSISCIKYPCAKTYSNSCFACLDEKVDYWTNEECPI